MLTRLAKARQTLNDIAFCRSASLILAWHASTNPIGGLRTGFEVQALLGVLWKRLLAGVSRPPRRLNLILNYLEPG